MFYFLDTSALLNGALKQYPKPQVWISPLSIQELENIKNSNRSDEIKYLARQTVRDIITSYDYNIYYANMQKVEKFIRKNSYLENTIDHKLLSSAAILAKEQQRPVQFVTSDGALYLFAQLIPGIDYTFFNKTQSNFDEQCGWKKYSPTEDEFISLYTHPEINILNAATNQFCELFENNELRDILFWNGTKYRTLKYKDFTSVLGEKIQPRNLEQKMYLDLLQNIDIPIKLCIAKFGTGKSYLALNYALHALQNGRFDKIIFVKNNLEVKGSGKLGTLPGDETSKQLPWLRQIEDHLGVQKFEEYIETGLIEPAHLSSLRGRDLKNSCIIVDEAENLLTTNIQLLLGRVAQNSEIIFCADIKQCDYQSKEMSGIPKLIERLSGHSLFGMVKLLKTERSAVAATADLLD